MGLGSPSAALWGTIKSLIPPKPEQEPRSFFSCMGAGGGGKWLVVFLWPPWCRGWLLCTKRAAKEGWQNLQNRL